MLKPVIITIIFYFENVAFFHAKLGSEVSPRVDNQTSGDTVRGLTRPLSYSGEIAISQLLVRIFGGEMLFHTNQIREETLGSGKLFSSSCIFPPPYL